MARELGYVSPLLSNLASDYAKKTREGLIAPILFPRIPVGKPSGKYAVFDKESAYKVPDVTMAGERSRAAEFASSGAMKNYATSRYGLKSFIDRADLEFFEGPFKLWERRKTEELVGKLEMAQEKRIAATVQTLSGRSVAPSTKWSGGAGNPHTDIKDAVAQLFYRPNLMIISETVFDAIEYHPKLLEKLGEANMIKKVDETTLGKLFRIDKVIVAKGKADFGKRSESKTASVTNIWGNAVVLAYVSAVWDEPCAGKTLAVTYKEADGSGYVVRMWDEEDGGILGGEYVQVAHDVCELVVAEDLIYTLKEVL
jgi:energy-coupling factor transporter ATP-binding protein EcfA2